MPRYDHGRFADDLKAVLATHGSQDQHLDRIQLEGVELPRKDLAPIRLEWKNPRRFHGQQSTVCVDRIRFGDVDDANGVHVPPLEHLRHDRVAPPGLVLIPTSPDRDSSRGQDR